MAAIEAEQRANDKMSTSVTNPTSDSPRSLAEPARTRSWPIHSDPYVNSLPPAQRPSLQFSPQNQLPITGKRKRFDPMVSDHVLPPPFQYLLGLTSSWSDNTYQQHTSPNLLTKLMANQKASKESWDPMVSPESLFHVSK
jgi:hypothetical protein